MCNLDIQSVQDEEGIDFLYAVANRPIDVGMVGEWKINIDIGKSFGAKSYMFTITADCGEFTQSEDFVVAVK